VPSNQHKPASRTYENALQHAHCNLSKIFGEAMLLIEADKRSQDWSVSLTYSDADSPKFYVPKNLYLLGMMNTADRSLAMVDYALRRRFAFFHAGPAFEQPAFCLNLEMAGVPIDLINHIKSRVGALNEKIEKDADLGTGFLIGHSFFCPDTPLMGTHATWYQRVIDTEIAPLLKGYWFDKKASQIADAVDALRFGAKN
jgi:5-methylcytosine-specific restriction enzyme B